MSLRARLLAGMALVAVVLVATAFLVARASEAYLVSQVDDRLASPSFEPRRDLTETRVGVGATVEDTAGEQQTFIAPPSGTFAFPAVNFEYRGVVQRDGTQTSLVQSNASGTDLATPKITWQQADESAESQQPFTVESSDSTVRYRALASRGPNISSDDLVFVTALPLADVDDAISRLITIEVIATLIALFVLSLVTWWVIRLGVQPIKRMTKAAAEIAAGDLSHRVPVTSSDTEAGELGLALNTMMGNIEGAFDERAASEDRLRRFIADASHELRTPVATVRGYAELYRVGGIGAGDPLDDAMRRTEQEAIRMGNLVDDLLQLARLDQGRPLEHEPVDLDRVVDDAAMDARVRDPERTVTVDVTPVAVLGDDERLHQVVNNLVSNALVHTPPGTPISLRLTREGDEAVVEIRDSGLGMAPDAVERAFERFYRADASRSRRAGGSGLGLSIVDAIVKEQGGTVTIESCLGKGTAVKVRLPSLTTA